MVKTLCYHKMYLEDTDLRDGYEMILKKIEQGVLTWNHDLAAELHQHLDYRANMILRKKLAEKESFSKLEKRAMSDLKKPDNNGANKVVYCLDYNLGQCQQPDHHEGRFNSKKVMKFHICRKCHKDGEFNTHKDSDNICPKKHS